MKRQLQNRLFKTLVEKLLSKLLRTGGVNGVVAGVASRLFYKLIVIPILKHLHKHDRLFIHSLGPKQKIMLKNHDDRWYPIDSL